MLWSRAPGTAGYWIAIVTLSMTLAAGCDVNRALKEQSEARRLSSDLLVQFTRAADAANRAVMADTDATSVEFAQEAEQARKGVQSDVDALRPVLQGLKFADEGRLLDQFVSRFAEYNALDRHVLELAVENTNLKAQRLSVTVPLRRRPTRCATRSERLSPRRLRMRGK